MRKKKVIYFTCDCLEKVLQNLLNYFFLSRDPSGLKQLKSVENFISDVDGKVRVHAYFVELSGKG